MSTMSRLRVCKYLLGRSSLCGATGSFAQNPPPADHPSVTVGPNLPYRDRSSLATWARRRTG
jgi:hypothetical protein